MKISAFVLAMISSVMLVSCGVGEVKQTVDENVEKVSEAIDENVEKVSEAIDENYGEMIDEGLQRLDNIGKPDPSTPMKEREIKFRYKQSALDDYGAAAAECFVNKDVEGLIGLFADRSIAEYDLEEQIENAFSFMNNEDIVSYGEIQSHIGGYTFGGGHTSALEGSVNIYDVKTESDTYEIFIGIVLVYDKDHDDVGIQNIKINDSEFDVYDLIEHEKKTYVTEPYEHRVEIGEFLDSWYATGGMSKGK